MKAPVTYVPGFVEAPAEAFDRLWNGLAWERRGLTPRREFYANDLGLPYTYGKGENARTYVPAAYSADMLAIKAAVESTLSTRLEACFLNGYENARDHLGWHADDSESMDDARPIAIVTLGAEREIWFAPKTGPKEAASIDRLVLGSGSLCVMAAGMQDEWVHRIPKAGYDCGPRISLTFRGCVAV